jgi:predicted DNA-binding transcriptional regulator YafY
LIKLRELFTSSPRAYSTSELAELHGVDVRTIQRDINTLQEMYETLEYKQGRWSRMRAQRLSPLNLTVQEARALFLAARLFLRHADDGDPDAAAALMRLAEIMPDPVRERVVAAAHSMERRTPNFTFVRVLQTVTTAWTRNRVVKLSYRSAGRQRPKEVIVHPYFIEPSAAGGATYLIAYSETHSSIRTFKVERIVSAELMPRDFKLPDDFDIEGLLSSAWGIIYGEGIDVRLRFAADVAWRVRETRWHPTQELTELTDGGIELRVSVPSMMELGRWVREWGDKVEVLAPEELRKELREESVRLARLYSQTPRAARKARAPKRRPPPPEQQALPGG